MALLLSAGMAVTTCPVPGAQEPPAEQIHTEQAEESSAAVHSDDSDREGTAADEFQSETEPSGSETETGAYEEETSENKNKKDNGAIIDMYPEFWTHIYKLGGHHGCFSVFYRRHPFCFCLDSFAIIVINIFINSNCKLFK